MSPVDRAGQVIGINEKFQPGFRDDKRLKILGRVLAQNSRNKENMAKHKTISLATIIAVSLQLNMMRKILFEKQDDSI